MQLPCPWCGPRNVAEFRHHGEVVSRPDLASATPEQWRGYLYLRRNVNGWSEETWYHAAGCRRYFRLRRHSASNEVRPIGTGAP